MKYQTIIYLFIAVIVVYFIFNKTGIFERFTNDDFDVYVINMVSNKERLESFKHQYEKSDLAWKNYIVYPAVVGKDLDIVNYVTPEAYSQLMEADAKKTRRHHYDITRGAVGCYLSHLDIYKKIAASDKKYGLIFEDDVMIATDFYKRMLFGLNTVPDDWDVYLLGLICLKCDVKNDYISVNRFWGTHGYLVKKDAALKLIENFDKLISKQIDADISLLIKQNKIKVYSINPIIVAQQNAFISDIQIPVENNIDAFNEEFNQKQIKNFKTKYKPTKMIKN
jgi:GR25 family glycosyltransferase involved in LPS biosynthesis